MWLDALNEMKKKSKKTLDDISLLSGVPKGTLNKLFSGQTKDPQLTTIKAVVHSLGYTVDDLFNSEKTNQQNKLLNKDFLYKYNLLDSHGKAVIDSTLKIELERIEAETKKATKQIMSIEAYSLDREKPHVEVTSIDFYDSTASAGMGSFLGDNPVSTVAFPAHKRIKEADFAVKVDGNSMEPVFFNNDLLLVKSQPNINHGELGVFVVNGMGYVKRFYNKGGVCKLVSLNIDYDDIVFHEEDEVECKGRVLGKINAGEWYEQVN